MNFSQFLKLHGNTEKKFLILSNVFSIFTELPQKFLVEIGQLIY